MALGGHISTIAAIIAVHNYERYLSTAIESLLNQAVPFDEIIVIDDGSTDDSLQVAMGFTPHVRVISQNNTGQLGACTRGVMETTADYVYFLDADDVAEPELLAVVKPTLVLQPAKVQFQLRSIDEDGLETGSIWPAFPVGYNAEAARSDNRVLGFYTCPATSGNVFSRALLLEQGPEEFHRDDPVDGTPALLAPYRGEIVSIGRALARYRVHSDSVSQWGRPTVEVVSHELEMHGRQRATVADLTGSRELGLDATAYILERRMILAVLRGQLISPGTLWTFWSRLSSSRLPRVQVLALVLWSALLSVTWGETRRSAMLRRRSPAARGAFSKRLVRLVRERSAARA